MIADKDIQIKVEWVANWIKLILFQILPDSTQW